MFTGNDVLRRASDILTVGPLTGKWAEHGEWCVYCAIALAKGQLDDEHGTGVSAGEAMKQVLTGIIEGPEDAPLVVARYRLAGAPIPSTQQEAIDMLYQAAEAA